MSNEQNNELIRKLFIEGINKRNYSMMDEYIAPGFVNHGIPNSKPGPEGFREILSQFIDAFPDLTITQESVIGEDGLVAARGYWTGTHSGSFMNIPATGKQVKVDYMDFWKIADGKCVENWVQMDIMGLMVQLGVMPS